jgi:hypothetical protein
MIWLYLPLSVRHSIPCMSIQGCTRHVIMAWYCRLPETYRPMSCWIKTAHWNGSARQWTKSVSVERTDMCKWGKKNQKLFLHWRAVRSWYYLIQDIFVLSRVLALEESSQSGHPQYMKWILQNSSHLLNFVLFGSVSQIITFNVFLLASYFKL